MPTGLLPDWAQSLMFFIFLLVTIYLVVQHANEMKKMQERARRKSRVVTRIECDGNTIERPFRDGDYVGKTEECEGKTGRIIAIYAIEEKPEGEKEAKKTP